MDRTISNLEIQQIIKDGFNVATMILPEFKDLMDNEGWSVHYRPDLVAKYPVPYGNCDHKLKQISILKVQAWQNEDGRIEWGVWHCYVIHECCHALARIDGHGEKWAEWMDIAKERAENAGEYKLAEYLDTDKTSMIKLGKIAKKKGWKTADELPPEFNDPAELERFLKDNGD